MIIKSHGIRYEKTGKCLRCGKCEKKNCPHFSMVGGLATCDTYEYGDYIEKRCHVFPDSPFCEVVRKGICGYKFKPVTDEDIKKHREYLKIWRLTD